MKNIFSQKIKSGVILGIIIAAACHSNFGYAATKYYVDAAVGNDAYAGTSTSPLKTIQAAANIVNPGDTVVVRNGIYTTNKSAFVDLSFGGSEGNPVTFIAEHPLGAKLDGKNSTVYGWVIEPNVAYVNIQGFEIINIGKTAINVSKNNSNINVTGNNIHNIGRVCTNSKLGYVGIYVGNSTSISIKNNIINDIGRYGPGENGCNPTNANYKNHDHAIYLNGVNGVNIQENTIYNINHGWGIHVYSGSGTMSSGVNITNNRFSYPNSYREGHIIIAYPGIDLSTISNNVFFQPTKQAIWFDSDTSLSSVTVSKNKTYAAVTSKIIPAGVSFSANKEIK